jgi:NADH-quinone oxidoreductase subunit A
VGSGAFGAGEARAVSPYIPILVMMLAATAIATLMIVASRFLGPRGPRSTNLEPYECGMTPIGSARVRFSVKFYLIAMLFILFDVEAIFLYPWAVVHRYLGWFGLVEMGVFMLILAVGYIYIWKRGAFEWE